MPSCSSIPFVFVFTCPLAFHLPATPSNPDCDVSHRASVATFLVVNCRAATASVSDVFLRSRPAAAPSHSSFDSDRKRADIPVRAGSDPAHPAAGCATGRRPARALLSLSRPFKGVCPEVSTAEPGERTLLTSSPAHSLCAPTGGTWQIPARK